MYMHIMTISIFILYLRNNMLDFTLMDQCSYFNRMHLVLACLERHASVLQAICDNNGEYWWRVKFLQRQMAYIWPDSMSIRISFSWLLHCRSNLFVYEMREFSCFHISGNALHKKKCSKCQYNVEHNYCKISW